MTFFSLINCDHVPYSSWSTMHIWSMGQRAQNLIGLLWQNLTFVVGAHENIMLYSLSSINPQHLLERWGEFNSCSIPRVYIRSFHGRLMDEIMKQAKLAMATKVSKYSPTRPTKEGSNKVTWYFWWEVSSFRKREEGGVFLKHGSSWSETRVGPSPLSHVPLCDFVASCLYVGVCFVQKASHFWCTLVWPFLSISSFLKIN